jgi:hypothetical protein
VKQRKITQSQRRGRAGGRAGGSGYDLQDLYIASQLTELLVGGRDPPVEVFWEKKAIDFGRKANAEPVHVDDAILHLKSGKRVYVEIKESQLGGWSAQRLVRSSVAQKFWQEWSLKKPEDRPDTLLRFASCGDLTTLQSIVDAARRSRTPQELKSEASSKILKEISVLAEALGLSADSADLLAFLKNIEPEPLLNSSHLEGRIIKGLSSYGESQARDLTQRLIRLVARSKHAGAEACSSVTKVSLVAALQHDGYPTEQLTDTTQRPDANSGRLPDPDADSPPCRSPRLPVHLPDCPFACDLGALWGLDRRRFLGIVVGSLDRVHTSLKRAERLLADSIVPDEDQIALRPILRWWIPVRYDGCYDGPSSVIGLYDSAENQQSKHLDALRAAHPKTLDLAGRMIVPSFLIRIAPAEFEAQRSSLGRDLANWCKDAAANVLPDLPVAIVIVVEASDAAADVASKLHQHVGPDQRWAFIERAEVAVDPTISRVCSTSAEDVVLTSTALATADKARPVSTVLHDGTYSASIPELATGEMTSVNLISLSKALDDDSNYDRAVDAWIVGTRLDPHLFPPRTWFSEQPSTRKLFLLRKMICAIMRAGAAENCHVNAVRILRSYEPLPEDLQSIVQLFQEPGPVPWGKLTPNLIELALNGRLDISLDDAEIPSPNDQEGSRAFWWTFMCIPPSLGCLRRVVRSMNRMHHAISGLCTIADRSFLDDPLFAEDIASLRRPGYRAHGASPRLNTTSTG